MKNILILLLASLVLAGCVATVTPNYGYHHAYHPVWHGYYHNYYD